MITAILSIWFVVSLVGIAVLGGLNRNNRLRGVPKTWRSICRRVCRDLVKIDPEVEVIGWRRDARGYAEFVVDRDGDEIPLPLLQLRGARDESRSRFEQRLRELVRPLNPRTN
jgi:hypothetical protein